MIGFVITAFLGFCAGVVIHRASFYSKLCKLESMQKNAFEQQEKAIKTINEYECLINEIKHD